MKCLVTFLIFALYSTAFSAHHLSVIKMEESGFQISIPKDWKNIEKKKLREPIVLSAIDRNREASLIVMVTTESKMTCKEFLASMDQSRNTKNNLPVDQQVVSAEFLKSSTASESVQGEYEIQGKGPGFPVTQKSICFKLKDKIRVLTGAFQKRKALIYEPLFKEIFTSFKFIPKTEPKQ